MTDGRPLLVKPVASAQRDIAIASRPLLGLQGHDVGLDVGTPGKSNNKYCVFNLLGFGSGGWGGIRTHEGLAPLPDFKSGAFNRSATHPRPRVQTAPESTTRYRHALEFSQSAGMLAPRCGGFASRRGLAIIA